jgi:hypothetical protein
VTPAPPRRPTDEPRRDLSERLEASRGGQLVLSAFVVVVLACIVVANLPESHVRREGLRAAGPLLRASGLDQDWRIFAPDPRRASIALEARITYADGSTVRWRPPAGGPLVGAYWDYRWRKWMEHVLFDARAAELWPDVAAFAARQVARPGRRPAHVTLWWTRRPLAAPGAPGAAPAAVAEPFYRVALREP